MKWIIKYSEPINASELDVEYINTVGGIFTRIDDRTFEFEADKSANPTSKKGTISNGI